MPSGEVRSDPFWGKLEFNIRDVDQITADVDSQFSREGIELVCANKAFCIQETLYDDTKHTKLVKADWGMVNAEKTKNALTHYRDLVGGSRVKKDPF